MNDERAPLFWAKIITLATLIGLCFLAAPNELEHVEKCLGTRTNAGGSDYLGGDCTSRLGGLEKAPFCAMAKVERFQRGQLFIERQIRREGPPVVYVAITARAPAALLTRPGS